MALVKEQAAFLLDSGRLVVYATGLGFTVTGGELARTQEQQAIYLKTGRSKTAKSDHLRRLAIDLNFFRDGALIYDADALRPIGEYWESLHPLNRWGGFWKSFKDLPHFERHVPE